MSVEAASGRGQKGIARLCENTEQQVVEDGHTVSGGTLFEAGAIFLESDIPAVVRAILDLPIRAEHVQEFFRRGLFSR